MAEVKKEVKFTDYLSVLYKWRKFIIINLVIVIIIATTLSFLIPKTYKATARIMLPPDNSMGIGSLSSLMGGGGLASMGAKLFGMSGSREDVIIGIMYSRTALLNAIEKFGLREYYGLEEGSRDKALRAIKNDVVFEPNEYGFIEVNAVNEDPERAAEIANYFVSLSDSLNTELNIQAARNNRKFIEKRFFRNVKELKEAEDALKNFQEEKGIFAVPEQIQVSVGAMAELEAQLAELEIIENSLSENLSKSSTVYQTLQSKVSAIKKKINQLKYNKTEKGEPNLLVPFSEAPELQLEYIRKYRAVEAQNRIMEFIYPLYEQAKIEEQKSMPGLLVIDEAIPPQLKYRPKKAFIILFAFFLVFFASVAVVFTGHKLVIAESYENEFQEKTAVIYKRILKIYRLNIKK